MTDIAPLKSWIGRKETVRDRVTPAPLSGLAALLDHDAPPWIVDEVPPLAHWLYFAPRTRQSELGEDGHPKRGGFLPPVDLPRRMFAGARIEFHAPIVTGAQLERVSTIADVKAKEGASGTMVFVNVRHEILANGVRALSEEQDIVYREVTNPAPAPAAPDTRASEFTRAIRPGPVLLFRYSALTFNAHRIHYDRDYCREVEFYPGLVVQGPLIATLLMDHFLRTHPGTRIARFSFRARRPLFDTAPFDLCMAERPGGADLWARNEKGEAAVTSVLETA